ncbi:VOC family protein [Geodermatophilus sp. TF02-6]|uniref:VOC family protein n=1 Tax=Geodermatophilus sp. TF02-6 TaxID=2250575 RepID=UPI001F2F4C38|nr:VOC family protein [Geodermatophilus sp. TF02-6]
MIFVNLPVADPDAAGEFYAALGFSLNPHFSDDRTAAVVVGDDIAVMLHARDRFADLVVGEAGDPAQTTTVVHGLTVDSRAEVDRLVARALEAGGKPWLPARDEESRYTGSFTDPDGNVWEAVWMDQLHVVN